MEEMSSRICVLEGNSDGEEKETSSSDGDMRKIGKADAESGREERRQTEKGMG